jgi:hypothetical protein
MESFLTTVDDLIRGKQLPALLIEDPAVTALGHPRATRKAGATPFPGL